MNRASSISTFELHDPVRLEDSVWTSLHIALYLGVKPSAALSVVNDYGFPRPLINKKRDRRWLADDVKRYFAKKTVTDFHHLVVLCCLYKRLPNHKLCKPLRGLFRRYSNHQWQTFLHLLGHQVVRRELFSTSLENYI